MYIVYRYMYIYVIYVTTVSIHDPLPMVFGLNYIFFKETLLVTKEGLIAMNGIQMSITKYIKCRPQRPNKRLKILYLYRYVDF
jgi:hypothetical protein